MRWRLAHDRRPPAGAVRRDARARRERAGGFTITELMVTVVIVAILATTAAPLMSGDRREADSRGFAASLARDLQRARSQAVADRLSVYAYVFLDRVEFRQDRMGALEGDEPIKALAEDAPIRVLSGKTGIRILNVTTNSTPPVTPSLSTSETTTIIRFDTLGGARLEADPNKPMFVWIEHEGLGIDHPYRRARIDITGLTGFVQLREQW